MKSSVEHLSPTRVKLTVDVPFEELKPGVDKAYSAIAQQIQVPGFRKGKVPKAIIDQRVGRPAVMEQAVNEGLNGFYQQAVSETDIHPLSQPEVDITALPDLTSFEGSLVFVVEVDVRPEFVLPSYEGLEITVDPVQTSEEDVETALDELRTRFGTLVGVDRPAAENDFVSMDLVATIDEQEVDSAKGISYHIGSATMLDGLDEALTGLSGGESAIFETTLVGGDHAGEKARVNVTVQSVKERELPEANDDFAQMASEFDTLDELKASLQEQVAQSKAHTQGIAARDRALELLLDAVEIPLPESVIKGEVERHFESADASHDTEEHRFSVREDAEKVFRTNLLLDILAEKLEINVTQEELIEYIVSSANQYGMSPNDFAQAIDSGGHVPSIVAEVGRRKALAKVLELAHVKDSNGEDIDLTAFVRPAAEVQEEETTESKPPSDDPASVSI